jgi:hypothetical protein
MLRKRFVRNAFSYALIIPLLFVLGTAPAWSQICPVDSKMLDAVPALNCFEFWLNRYQTLLGTFVGAIAILVAYLGLRQQMALERQLSKTDFVEHWRHWCAVAEETCNLIVASVPIEGPEKEYFERADIFNRYLPGAMTVDVYVETGLNDLEQIKAKIRPTLQPAASRFEASLRTIGGLSRWLATSNNASTPSAKAALQRMVTLIFNARARLGELKKLEG